MAEFVTTERRRAVLVITLDRPEARNAVNRAVSLEMAEALDASRPITTSSLR